MTGDKDGLRSLSELLLMMYNEDVNTNRTLTLSTPGVSELAISGCKNKPVPENKVKLYFEAEEVEEWTIKPFFGTMDIVMNSYSTKGFRDSLLRRINGENDFTFGHGENQLWFW